MSLLGDGDSGIGVTGGTSAAGSSSNTAADSDSGMQCLPSTSSMNNDVYKIEEEEDGEELVLADRLPEAELRMSQPRPLLLIYAVISVLLGLIVFGIGLPSFFIIADHQKRNSMQIELKWVNLVLLFSGLSGILVLRLQTAAFLCASICFSLLASAVGFCTLILHSVNVVFRHKEIDHYNETGEHDMKQSTSSVAIINLLFAGVGGLACVISMLLYRHTLHLMGKNFNYSLAPMVEKHRFKLSMVGLSHIIIGLMVTAFWIGIELLLQSMGMNLRGLPGTTSEVLSHGLVLVVCGYVQMMATSKGNQPILVCAGVFNAVAFLLATFFSSKPLSLMHTVIDHAQSTRIEAMLDLRVWLCALLSFIYIFEILIAIYSFIKFLHLAANDSISRVDNLLKIRGSVFAFSVVTIGAGLLYAMLEIGAVSEYFLYKLEPTPLPLYLIACGLFGYGAVNMGSAWLLLVAAALAPLCAALSARDVYLFLYHTVAFGVNGASRRRVTTFRLFFHFVLASVAFVVLLVAAIVCVCFARAFVNTVSCLYNKMEFPRTLLCVRLLSIAQTVIALFIMVLGFVMFVSTETLLVHFGDSSMSIGLLFLLAATLQLLSLRKSPSLLPLSLMIQLGSVTILWQQLDSYSYLVHEYVGSRDAGAWAFALAVALMAVYLVYFCIACLLLLLQANILETCRFSLIERNATKLEEFVAMGDNQEMQ